MKTRHSAPGSTVPILVLAALAAATPALVEPVRLLALNWNEMSIGFGVALVKLAPPALALFAVLGVLGLAAARLAGDRVVALLSMLHAALWMQTCVLVWDYGVFDGTPIHWREYGFRPHLEWAMWAGFAALALLRPRAVREHWAWIALAVVALQGAAVSSDLLRASPFSARSTPDPGADLNVYSLDRNAIVIVLDSVQSDFLGEALLDPEFAASVPPGFTWYRNATSLYAQTRFSLPSILTSKSAPADIDDASFLRDSAATSLPSQLAALGFDSALAALAITRLPSCQLPDGPVRCLWLTQLVVPDGAVAMANLWRADVSELVHVALFRSAPHSLKHRLMPHRMWTLPALYPLVEDPSDIDSRIHGASRVDLLVLRRLTREIVAADVPPRFRLLHLFGAHVPASLDRDCEFAGTKARPENSDREPFVEATRCLLSRVFAYLQALDEAGLYDASAVLVISDHGHLVPLDPSVARPPLPPPPAGTGDLPGFFRGNALFLAKQRGARGGLTISDAPVSLCDVPASLYDAMEVSGVADCSSVFDANAPRGVRRFYAAVQDKNAGSHKNRLEFESYRIEGHAWHAQSWRRDMEPEPPAVHDAD